MDVSAGAMQAAGDEVQVTLQFITKLPAEFRVSETPVTVPANLTRYGLSQIINHLLALDPSRPFDFLVDGQLLRLSLHRHLQAKQLSTEAVLHVEYVPAVLPPTPGDENTHEDWVACIAALAQPAAKTRSAAAAPLVATGCYDGIVRLWRSGECASRFAAHKGPVKACAAVAGGAGRPLLVTAGDDCVARAWEWEAAPAAAGEVAAPQPLALLRGHSASVEALAASPDGQRCATGGWDSKLLVWRCGAALAASAADGDDGEQPAAAARKRRKAGAAAAGVPSALHEERALESLAGHSQCVSSLAWPSELVLVSASWDHSLRLWDADTGVNTATFNHNKALHCVAAAPGESGVVAFGGAERAVRVWDSRAGRGGDALAVQALTSHTDWISALSWHPTSQHHLLSASYDGTAKLWDVRAAVPLHTLPPAGAKLLAAAWVGDGEAATGGVDCTLRTAHVEVAA